MKMNMDTIKRLLKEEEGYGTVEMILIIAGIGILTTGIFNVLTDSLAGKGSNSAVNQVANSISDIIGGWNGGAD